MSQDRPSKRTKLSSASSLNRDISPPPLRRQTGTSTPASRPNSKNAPSPASTATLEPSSPIPHPDTIDLTSPAPDDTPTSDTLIISSPFKLTHIANFTRNQNLDTVTISDILGNPLIKEVWSFNFMHDLTWLVSHLDQDIARSINIKIVHGNWKREDAYRAQLEEEKETLTSTENETGGYQIELITAYMPDAFGTHHTKMLVLFYHDDTAEVVIHTANMIPYDWANMTQAVWRSPKLPLMPDQGFERQEGIGYNFKEGLIAYLQAYQWRTAPLVKTLRMYDFRDVRAIFVGHVPGEHPVNGREDKLFGWAKVKRALTRVGRGGGWGINKAGRCVTEVQGGGKMVMQCSSVGTLGRSYFEDVLYPAFSICRPNGNGTSSFFTASQSSTSSSSSTTTSSKLMTAAPEFALIFPTVENVRTSVNGYEGGGPVHMKGRTLAHKGQIKYLKPILAVWGQPSFGISGNAMVEAERGKATPHIKTYNFFSPAKSETERQVKKAKTAKVYIGNDEETEDEDDEDGEDKTVAMDWAMITSANLSKQAWGLPAKKETSTSKIQSYEVGVLVHPGLWKDLLKDDKGVVTMSAVGGKDWVTGEGEKIPNSELNEDIEGKWGMVKVGIRLAYDYPLKRYEEKDEPWCQDGMYGQRDRLGYTWPRQMIDIFREEFAGNGIAPDEDY
ncbi:hypothetical protein ABW20_dc0103192 [Dactylellina cionopaga]|nr:hypothetical protein ABW20_dc0103192 [Dactylellina cionopaga]